MVRLKTALKALNIDCNTSGEVRIGGDNDYLKVASDGQLHLIGGAVQWLDIYRDWETDRKSTRLNSSHSAKSRMPSSA